ncbi:MAG: helix-turn-helix domain-containing protein [Blastochloris sp.]|nr:helix-turn-helix domain-containing protein [Blastochloris sp.]
MKNVILSYDFVIHRLVTMQRPELFATHRSGGKETRSSVRYHWHCRDRGALAQVIIQQTLSGKGCFEDRQGRREVDVDWAFLALVPGEARYYYPAGAQMPWTFQWINLYGPESLRWGENLQKRFGSVLPLSRTSRPGHLFRKLVTQSRHKQAMQACQHSAQIYTFIMEWWAWLEHRLPVKSDGMKTAISHVRSHFREPLTVKELAQQAGCSREHFSRAFKQETGTTPALFLRQLRLQSARSLLQKTALPLREIAQQSGFSSAQHLLKAYQRHEGKSPRNP